MANVVKEARSRLEEATRYWADIYRKGKEDQEFLSDTAGSQWDERDYADRINKRRPAITVDQLGQFVNQVVNNIRMNTPAINVAPKGGGADSVHAEIMQGLIRNIEWESRADSAYDTAAQFSVEASIGYLRVDHDYEKEDGGWEQVLKVLRVNNPFLVFFDPDSVEPDGSDARYVFLVELMSHEEHKRRFPGQAIETLELGCLPDPTEDHVYVAEYYCIKEQEKFLVQLPTGETVELDEEPEEAIASRPIKSRIVKRYWINGTRELKEGTFPGKYLPIIPVYGREVWVNGKRELHSLIRKSKDAQRMYNYWRSVEAELLQKAPKPAVVAPAGATEAYAEDYLNPDKAQVLRYEQYDEQGRPYNPPELSMPTPVPMGIVNAARESVDDIKSTMGMYNASLGQVSNETSGKAINARRSLGDRATYHFGDNLVRSISHLGRVLVNAIPIIYDTPRIVSVVGKEDTQEVVGINGALVPGQEQTYDLTRGIYAVHVTTGDSYATQREEAAEYFQQLLMTKPEMIEVIGDLMFKYQDFPGSQAISERLRRLIPAHLRSDGEENPELMQAMQQVQQLTQQVQALQQQLQSKQEELQLKAQTEQMKTESEQYKANLDHQETMAELQYKQQELRVKRKELELQSRQLEAELQRLAQPDNLQPNET